ncbi:hypothetical protein OPV22_022612 [Ensete ventricosum]|uniref:Uncharacterized protein n=1 Tax=Ensete ventricosum TaxID=4639 RepID=A0AAV8QSW5_ENSVE|nr:hypothetical protein OPV22_022612 [Ensete ventricosum]
MGALSPARSPVSPETLSPSLPISFVYFITTVTQFFNLHQTFFPQASQILTDLKSRRRQSANRSLGYSNMIHIEEVSNQWYLKNLLRLGNKRGPDKENDIIHMYIIILFIIVTLLHALIHQPPLSQIYLSEETRTSGRREIPLSVALLKQVIIRKYILLASKYLKMILKQRNHSCLLAVGQIIRSITWMEGNNEAVSRGGVVACKWLVQHTRSRDIHADRRLYGRNGDIVDQINATERNNTYCNSSSPIHACLGGYYYQGVWVVLGIWVWSCRDIMRFWYFNSYPGVLAAAAAAAALKVSPLLPLLTMAPNHALAPAPSVNLGGE